jgi:hypothetical protein
VLPQANRKTELYTIVEGNNLGEFAWQFNTKEGPQPKKEDP